MADETGTEMEVVVVEDPQLPALAGEGGPVARFIARFASQASRKTMADALDRAAGVLGRKVEEIPWGQMTFDVVEMMKTRLIEKDYSANTVNVTLSAVRGLLKTYWRMGLMDHDAYQRCADVPPYRVDSLPAGRMLQKPELEVLFAAASKAPGPPSLVVRDLAMLAVLLGCGLRAAEVTHLRLEDYDPESGELRVLKGKGRKDRIVYLATPGRRALARWLVVRGTAAGALFCHARHTGKAILIPHLSCKGVYYRVRKLLAAARLAHASPHDFRRTYISMLLENGADISTVQQLAGHSQVTTTQRYDRRGEITKRTASEGVWIPYQEDEEGAQDQSRAAVDPGRGDADRAEAAASEPGVGSEVPSEAHP